MAPINFSHGLDNVPFQPPYSFGAATSDYYRMLDGDDLAKRHYTGEYMIQYSWAEYTNSWLEGLSSRLKP